jgi:hypothetical protein
MRAADPPDSAAVFAPRFMECLSLDAARAIWPVPVRCGCRISSEGCSILVAGPELATDG